MGIKGFIVNKIIQLSSDEATASAERTMIHQMNKVLVSILKQEWKSTFKMEDAVGLAIKVLTKTMDSNNLNSENIEFARVDRDETTGKVRFYPYPKEELDDLLQAVIQKQQQEEKEKEEKLEREIAARQQAQRRR